MRWFWALDPLPLSNGQMWKKWSKCLLPFVRTYIVPSFLPFLDEAGNSILVSRRILIGNVKTQCYDLISFRKCVIIKNILKRKVCWASKDFKQLLKD